MPRTKGKSMMRIIERTVKYKTLYCSSAPVNLFSQAETFDYERTRRPLVRPRIHKINNEIA